MDSKTMCSLSMFLALVISIEVVSMFVPHLNVFLLVLSWTVSAIYLELLDWGTWVKTWLMLEASKLPRYYDAVLRTNAMGANANRFLSVLYAFDPDIQNDLVVDKLVFEGAGWWIPVIAILVTYAGIYVIYRRLCVSGFFRRLLV